MSRVICRPNFLNHVDKTIIFNNLTIDHIKGIVDIQLERLYKRLKQHNITLNVTDEVKGLLAEMGDGSVYGALAQADDPTPLARPISQADAGRPSTRLRIKLGCGWEVVRI